MKINKLRIVIAVSLGICMVCGCAANKSSGIVPSGKETYTIIITPDPWTVSGYGVDIGPGALMKQAYEEANTFCETRGKVMQPISTQSSVYPQACFELRFRALDPDDPEYKRPILEPVPDTKIEVHSQ